MGATLTDPLVGRLVDGRYLVVSRIARGGMATVYRAVDRRLDREVALKVMHPHLADGAEGADFVSRFRREARAAARLAHPGLVAVFDQGVDGDTSYLTMELIDGSTLRRRLREQGTLPVGEALDIAEAVLDALTAAHRTGLVHRDIKPENVLISEEGRVKVADFGLARAVTEVTSTATGTVFGTVAYLAPEIILTGACDARTDVYAVGILLHEMLTGAQPHTGATPIQVAYRHVNVDVPDVSDVATDMPTEIDELVAAFAARDAENRPPDAAAALDLLRRTRGALTPEDLALRHEVPLAETPEPEATDDDEPQLPPVPPPPGAEGSAETPGSAGSASSPVSAPSPEEDDDRTEALGLVGSGTTIALPIGTGAVAPVDTVGPALRARRRRRALVATLVVVLVAALAGGATLWWATWGPGAYTTVPSGLVGAEAEAATNALATLGLHADTSQAVHDDDVPAGSVVSVEPREGEEIHKEGTVRLVVSLGILMLTVPDDLVGATAEQAHARLAEARLEAAPDVLVHDDKVPAGEVMSVDQEEGTEVPHSTPVTLTVSDGPAPVTVPQVVGSQSKNASATLKSVGLKVKVTKEFSETVPEGAVISQTPEASSAAHRTDTVTIVVSKGPPLVEVPGVVGKSAADAEEILRKAGFVPDVKKQWGGLLNIVRFQSVDPGDKIPKGSTVSITVV
ncbi:Stk1 family PASTA domain-containing Ser/Thr kinase [Flavimobilis sp. GY10621]|uniref:non-specific serine/threonine protein kinase n=1 Tax=Flavimobilis rhizosphaerae TaxID=2775421 RepID=A0ABR9DT59_9MICO|nr:Stk1 family PASTA domain-containing Ser/Thr kinase [Flavimobilis rhizosphaerae]MBD9700253.1 Stk1 family PASTA domain-containing Ser/Thr kinase [Flavimobilis rhizosphaerae]